MRLALMTTLFLLVAANKSMAAMEEISNFQLKVCQKSFCTHLKTKSAQKSDLDNIYVFGAAELTTYSTDSGKIMRVEKINKGSEGYYDPIYSRIVLRGLKGKYEELVFNIKNGAENYF